REYTRELHDLAWFDEGKTTLTLRVQQLMTGIHWAEEPLSRMSHLVTNVRLIKAVPSVREPEEVTVRCRFIVYRNRLQDETDLFVGKREDVLHKVDGEWKIASRKIYLDQNVLLSKNLTFLF
ncbi:MAG TPA: aromatic-ring-hydroxylating dioxygenase subunit beta, partial [Dehalococcoidia bacterium]|nr:aromatic-ring-hydroxylating dioxygenase subunit beta [Dehalococcoidia bacterium]